MTEDLLWPPYATPADLEVIEQVPLAARGLPESTYALLVRAAENWPDRTAISVLPGEADWRQPARRTFAELLADVHRYANQMHQLGVRRHNTVALMAPNCAELIPATLAAQLAGIAVPLNGGLSRPHLAELLRRSGARVLVAAGPEVSPDMWKTACALAEAGAVDALLALRPTYPEGPAGPLPHIAGVTTAYISELSAGADAATFAGDLPSPADLAALFHTGGTTGAPKLAAHRHGNEIADSWALAANSAFEADSVVFAALPLFHVNALVVTLLAPLFKGQCTVWGGPAGYRDPALLQQFWQIVEHYRITTMSAVPTVYAALTRCPVDADISSLRFAMVGASPLPPAVRDGFEKHTGVPLLEGYGLTEATCASARSFPAYPRPESVGQRMPYQKIKIVGDGTREQVPPGRTGLLMISGPTVFAGYVTGYGADGPILDGLGRLVDGWLDTGDLASVDADGFIRLVGRAKDLIIRGGHNIDPAIIEDALLAHPQVSAASAVGRPDAYAGEVPVAYVTLAPNAAVTEADLLAWAYEQVVEPAAAPKTVTVLDALPVTAVGKLYKLALRADAAQRELAAALTDVAGIGEITTSVEDGAIVATVRTTPSEQAATEAVLQRYAIPWKVVVSS
jgi:fatty-acyl-CoA synthase